MIANNECTTKIVYKFFHIITINASWLWTSKYGPKCQIQVLDNIAAHKIYCPMLLCRPNCTCVFRVLGVLVLWLVCSSPRARGNSIHGPTRWNWQGMYYSASVLYTPAHMPYRARRACFYVLRRYFNIYDSWIVVIGLYELNISVLTTYITHIYVVCICILWEKGWYLTNWYLFNKYTKLIKYGITGRWMATIICLGHRLCSEKRPLS